jgi:putative Ca2+/H+ antiporter (TMEM165/GDT1 family)
MDAFLVSTGIVALAEIGDKTQLLAFILATNFRKPIPIVLGILITTIANHAFAGAALVSRRIIYRHGYLDIDP